MKKILLTICAALSINAANAQCNDLFISEYVEGTNNNKAIEVYNASSAPISLANYRLVRWDNGSVIADQSPEGVLQLPTNITLQPYKTYVMALNLTDPNGTGQTQPIDTALQNVADTLLCPGCAPAGLSRVLCFNGDDALSLQKKVGTNWVNVDIFACIGERPTNSVGSYSPTAAWTILPPFSSMNPNYDAATEGPYFLKYWTQDKTLRRKPSIQTGVTTNPAVETFNASVQWDSLPVNTFTELRKHSCECECIGFASLAITSTSTAACEGSNTGGIVLNASLPSSATYAWSNGSTSPNLTNVTPGNYTLTVTSNGGCTKTYSTTIPTLPSPTATFTTTSTSSCGAADGGASIVASGGVSPYTYLWSNGSSSATITGVTAGAFSCTVTGANACNSIVNVNINDGGAPTLTLDSTIAASCDTCTNGSIFVSTTAGANATYVWENLTGDTVGTSTDISNLIPGTYTLTITVDSCIATATAIVGNTVGIKNIEPKANVNIFPNPSNIGKFIIISDNLIESVIVYNSIGKIVINNNLVGKSNSTEIVTSQLENGFYLVRIKNIDGRIATKKVTIN